MPFEQQVNLMRNTRILIAPHGAGTLNQIFMPRGGRIIELFPKGYSNWHAAAIAEIFGHELIEIESDAPGVIGRQPTEAIQRLIEEKGWPDRATVRASRAQSEDLLRVVRDVSSFSIDPAMIVNALRNWPLNIPTKITFKTKVYRTPLWGPRGHFHPDQADKYAEICHRVRPRYALEIGFCTGRSAAAVLCYAKSTLKKMISIDMDLDYKKPDGRKMSAMLQKTFTHFKVIEKAASDILTPKFFSREFPTGLDFVTIDGSHRYEECLFDMASFGTASISSFKSSGGY